MKITDPVEKVGLENLLHIEVSLATVDERPILRHLMELYQYDFSEYDHAYVGSMGLFDYPYLDHYWVEDGREPYLVRVANRLAGFVLVSRYNYLNEAGDTWVISEFFILRKYRRQGVGEHVARWIFDHHPGPWQVSELSENPGAIAFWSKVIERYTQNKYEEYTLDNHRWHGPVQAFIAVSADVTKD
jgi:predicted acetyltransferase